MSDNAFKDIPVCTEVPNDLEISEITCEGYILKIGYDRKQDVVYLLDGKRGKSKDDPKNQQNSTK